MKLQKLLALETRKHRAFLWLLKDEDGRWERFRKFRDRCTRRQHRMLGGLHDRWKRLSIAISLKAMAGSQRADVYFEWEMGQFARDLGKT